MFKFRPYPHDLLSYVYKTLNLSPVSPRLRPLFPSSPLLPLYYLMVKGKKGTAPAQGQPVSASPLPPPASNARTTRSRTNAALSEPRVQVKRTHPRDEPELCVVQPKKQKNKVRFPLRLCLLTPS